MGGFQNEDVIDLQDMCAGVVTGGDGSAQKARGCLTARSGVGVYTVTMDPDILGGPGIVADETVAEIGVVNATPQISAFENTSNTVKTVRIATQLGAAVDSDFTFLFSRLLG